MNHQLLFYTSSTTEPLQLVQSAVAGCAEVALLMTVSQGALFDLQCQFRLAREQTDQPQFAS